LIDLSKIGYWYNEQKQGLDEEFFKEAAHVLSRATKNPFIFTHINEKVRRYKPKRFLYYIYFSHTNGITVLRVRHVKQQPLKRFT